jgi:hypothetical protein
VNNVIAARALVCVTASGERTPFTVRLGTPYYDPRGNWACPVALDGSEHPLIDIAGIDAWQALVLARRVAYQLLASRSEKDASYIDAMKGNVVDLRELFDGGLEPFNPDAGGAHRAKP